MCTLENIIMCASKHTMCALRAAHKISTFNKMCAMRCINAQNGHLAQLKSEGEANAQNKMCKNRSSFWAPWVMQILESVFISIAAILWKENIHRFCRSESIPNVIQRFGSFLVFFTKCKLCRVVYFNCSPVKGEHPQVLSTQISNQLEKLDSQWDFHLQTCWTLFLNCATVNTPPKLMEVIVKMRIGTRTSYLTMIWHTAGTLALI